MQPITIQFAVRVVCVMTIRISREINIMQIDLPDGSTSALAHVYLGDIWCTSADWLNCKMDSKIGFEMSLIVVEAIRGRRASFMVLTATVSEIFGGRIAIQCS